MTRNERKLEKGDVVQLGPGVGSMFAYTFMTVIELNRGGAQGFVKTLGANGGLTYIQVKWEDMAYIGIAEWMPEEDA